MQKAFDVARENMIEGQIRPNKVTDPDIIDAMSRVPRERFVPRHLQGIAYVDEDIAMGNGRYLPEPVVLARLLQAAEISKNDVVLDIGCGTGYSAAVLGCLAATVVGLEQDDAMANEADTLLHNLDVCNAVVIQKPDLTKGYPEQGPYDVIVINGSVAQVPQNLFDQLAEGGRLVTVVSDNGHMGKAMLYERIGGHVSPQELFDAATPFLAGFERDETFTF